MTAGGHIGKRIHLPGSGRQLALARVAVALHLLTVFASPVFPLLLEIGAHPHPMAGTYVPSGLEGLIATHLKAVLLVGLVACVAMALGLFTRLAVPTALFAFFATQNYWFRATVFHDDWLYHTFLLLVLCFAPCADVWSMDAWILRRRGRSIDRDPQQYRWPVEAMLLWIALLYVGAGLAKLLPLRKGLMWLTGNSVRQFAVEFVRDSPLYWWLGQAPFDYTLLWPFAIFSWMTVTLELGAAALVLTERHRGMLVLALLSMHVAIYLQGIPGFVQIALSWMVVTLRPEVFGDVLRPRAAAEPTPES